MMTPADKALLSLGLAIAADPMTPEELSQRVTDLLAIPGMDKTLQRATMTPRVYDHPGLSPGYYLPGLPRGVTLVAILGDRVVVLKEEQPQTFPLPRLPQAS